MLTPKDGDAYLRRGFAYYNRGRYDEAIADYTRVIELSPKNRLAYFNRGDAYDEKKLYLQAIADYNQAIAIDPQYNDAYFNKAGSCAKAGQYQEAIEAYTQYIRHAELPRDNLAVEAARNRISELAETAAIGKAKVEF